MNYKLDQIPFFQQLSDSQTILLAGAGGGFDIFCGIPLYLNLVKQGKKVIISNFAFTWLSRTTAHQVYPYCYEIQAKDQDLSGRNYFPEKYLKAWLQIQGYDAKVYGFERTGVAPLRDAYHYLIKTHEIDTVLLIDGGTDSLMFGDEEGLGTPQEDICSMAAVYRTGIKKQFLVNLGFGVDHFHGVSHFRFLENVAKLSETGAYLGLFQLLREMEEGQLYANAVEYANQRMPGMESIVSNSIISALDGEYGDYHRTQRTTGSHLWINPLMTIYWAFNLRKLVPQIKYYHQIKHTNTLAEFNAKLSAYRSALKEYRRSQQIPI
ncbi:MAG: DUF1152 domain-containing protein [Saprospiraceae bacterium]|nr:DUF1152 domain-containing protein [Saprospiraceae bacterium]